MEVAVDLSFYPLHQDYDEKIISFIDKLKEYPELKITTTTLNTQIRGSYDKIMILLTEKMKQELLQGDAVFMIKIIGRK